MTYFKVGNGVPTGAYPGEDAVAFNPATVAATQVGGSWKVADGAHFLLDFGASEANASKAVWLIKKYGFRFICFVGRPNPPMMYFRR